MCGLWFLLFLLIMILVQHVLLLPQWCSEARVTLTVIMFNQENTMHKWAWYLDISLLRVQSFILESQSGFGVVRLIDTSMSFFWLFFLCRQHKESLHSSFLVLQSKWLRYLLPYHVPRSGLSYSVYTNRLNMRVVSLITPVSTWFS